MIDIFTLFHHIPIIDLLAVDPPDSVGLEDNIEMLKECLGSLTNNNSIALTCSDAQSNFTAKLWDEIWYNKIALSSTEFSVMMNISRYIAGPAIVFWAISGLKDVHRNGIVDGWHSMFTVFFLALIIYANNAYIPRNMIMATRGLMNYQNSLILQAANTTNKIEAKFQSITDYDITENALVAIREQCNGFTRNQEMLDCLEEAQPQADAIIAKYEAKHPESPRFGEKLKNYAVTTITNPKEAIKQAIVNSPGVAIAKVAFRFAGKVANQGVSIVAQGWMSSMSMAVQYLVELSWLFTALVLPIPLALSFYPGTRNILIGWLVGFLTLGLFKINLNIAVAITVYMLFTRGPGEPIQDVLMLAIGVVILAAGMTAGGGMAIFSGVTSAISGLTAGILSFGVSKLMRR